MNIFFFLEQNGRTPSSTRVRSGHDQGPEGSAEACSERREGDEAAARHVQDLHEGAAGQSSADGRRKESQSRTGRNQKSGQS